MTTWKTQTSCRRKHGIDWAFSPEHFFKCNHQQQTTDGNTRNPDGKPTVFADKEVKKMRERFAGTKKLCLPSLVIKTITLLFSSLICGLTLSKTARSSG